MKTCNKLLSLLLALCLMVTCLAGCQDDGSKADENSAAEFVDYVAETKLNLNSSTKKQEVTVKSYIDGDTTHFFVPTSLCDDGVLKARYMAVNTPESTGKIEEWGKKASSFTKEKLMNASSIYIESNDSNWNVDSTGDRHLVWVWYKPKDGGDYRCLNLELIQNGLSIACGSVSDLYGQAASNAFQQAKREKLHVFSGTTDPDFYYGDAYELDLKHLRTNISLYENMKVAFEGVVTYNNNNSVYVEEYDAETDMYYGVSVYYGFETGELLNMLKIGNRVRVVGSVQYYEAGGTWQISDVSYREFKPTDPSNTIKISEGHAAAHRELDADTFLNGTMDMETAVSLDSEDVETKNFKYADLILSTSVSMKNLQVVDIYTTSNGGNNDGAMTLTCKSGDTFVDVRTIVLYDANGNMLTESDFLGKTIDVKGIVDYFSGSHQIKVFTSSDIVIK
ncbi:MAG: thermonuclease family protein [Clostridia bacterium]|nr:thermonuclease family protein [Clostridia bacterium]